VIALGREARADPVSEHRAVGADVHGDVEAREQPPPGRQLGAGREQDRLRRRRRLFGPPAARVFGGAPALGAQPERVERRARVGDGRGGGEPARQRVAEAGRGGAAADAGPAPVEREPAGDGGGGERRGEQRERPAREPQ
jgi:hypothetical protein